MSEPSDAERQELISRLLDGGRAVPAGRRFRERIHELAQLCREAAAALAVAPVIHTCTTARGEACGLQWIGPWTDCPGCTAKAAMLAISELKQQLAVAPVSPWQAIESAPKDGTHVVLFGTLWNDPDVRPRSCVSWYCISRADSPAYALGWFFSAPGYTNGFNPTHWLPFPASPAKET